MFQPSSPFSPRNMTHTTLLPRNHTSLGSWVLLISKVIDSYGVDSKKIFSNAGIELGSIKQPQNRISTAHMAHVWDEARTQSQDPYIALRVAEQFQPMALSALGMAFSASRNAYDALKRANRYSQMLSDGTATEIEENDTCVTFILKYKSRLTMAVHDLGIESGIGVLVNSLRLLAGKDFTPTCISFEHDFSGDTKPYEKFFGCPVLFSAPRTQMEFNKAEMFTEHPFADSALTNTLDSWIEEHLSNFKKELTSTKIKKYLLKNLAYGKVGQKSAAQSLALSPRVMQRRLKDEGMTFSQVLDDCRQNLAVKLISKDKLSLAEVAFILGFSDQSNFSRAFKRWTGSSPNEYKF